MKITAKHILLPCLAALLCSCASRREGWKLVWKDNFKGNALDEASWSRVAQGGADWNDMMSLRPDLVRVADGQLILLGLVNDHSSSDTTAYVTGGVRSSGKKSFSMGRYEVRAKFNSARGFWPALWLMPDTKVKEGDYAEIDLMEHLNHDNKVYQTLHSRFSVLLAKWLHPC